MSRDNLLHVSLLTDPDSAPANRMRGTSTALALRYTSEAILKPNTVIVVKDHVDLPEFNARLLRSIKWVVVRLRLIGFEVGFDQMLGKHFVRCNLHVPPQT
jgi:hypothetical protein